MGFFSSIGDFVSDAWDGVKDVVDTVSPVLVDTVSPVLGPAGDIVGGLLGSSSQSEANATNAALAQQQIAYQKEYAKNRLQWQVEDAKKAGLHPMVSAGLSPVSFSPVSAQQSPIDYDWVGEAGQSLSYAAAKAKDQEQQRQAWQFQKELAEEQITGVRLDNELKVMQILSDVARLNQTGPAAPSLNPKTLIGGQNDVPYSLDTPYGKSLYHLFTIARHGDTLVETPHPDIADSITETEWKNILASIDAEIQTQGGTIKPPVYLLSPSEREAVRQHRYELVRIPGVGWKLDRNPSRPHPYHDKLSAYEKFKRKNTQRWNGKQSVSGKIF